jgi:formamidopyrimidine-DNA glycosylase
MPELPEVEQFRQLLLPLVSSSSPIQISAWKDNPPRVWLSEEQINSLSGKYYCVDILRKGKQLCIVLQPSKANGQKKEPKKSVYLYLHMGMTGRISSPNRESGWGHQNSKVADIEYPPRYTYLTFATEHYQAAFSDPRKFGKAVLSDNLDPFGLLAPDALNCNDEKLIRNEIIPGFVEQTRSIKAILLDQNRVCSGVGNWVADEVLYQIGMHPDQQYLTEEQGSRLFETLQAIVRTAVGCLNSDTKYPDSWLFGYRWTKKRAGKDAAGRALTFLTSGGRTSAIVASVQKLNKRQGRRNSSENSHRNTHVKMTAEMVEEEQNYPKRKAKRIKRTAIVSPLSEKVGESGMKRDFILEEKLTVRRSSRLRL